MFIKVKIKGVLNEKRCKSSRVCTDRCDYEDP